MKNKNLILLIYSILWLLIVLVQSLLMGQSTPSTPTFWVAPISYISTWFTDLYLVALFYINYRYVSVRFFQRKTFSVYAVFVGAATLLGLFMPMMFDGFFNLGTPTEEPGRVGLSIFGSFGALALLSVGLSIQAIKQWIILNDLTQQQSVEINQLKGIICEKDSQLASLRAEAPAPAPASSTSYGRPDPSAVGESLNNLLMHREHIMKADW